jgi:hypothetical protein
VAVHEIYFTCGGADLGLFINQIYFCRRYYMYYDELNDEELIEFKRKLQILELFQNDQFRRSI